MDFFGIILQLLCGHLGHVRATVGYFEVTSGLLWGDFDFEDMAVRQKKKTIIFRTHFNDSIKLSSQCLVPLKLILIKMTLNLKKNPFRIVKSIRVQVRFGLAPKSVPNQFLSKLNTFSLHTCRHFGGYVSKNKFAVYQCMQICPTMSPGNEFVCDCFFVSPTQG